MIYTVKNCVAAQLPDDSYRLFAVLAEGGVGVYRGETYTDKADADSMAKQVIACETIDTANCWVIEAVPTCN